MSKAAKNKTNQNPIKKCRGCKEKCETFIVKGRLADTKIYICAKTEQ